jgi:hypothetical protein
MGLEEREMIDKDDLIEYAWAVIANAGQGDWKREHPDWQKSAERWRDEYHQYLNETKHHGDGTPEHEHNTSCAHVVGGCELCCTLG